MKRTLLFITLIFTLTHLSAKEESLNVTSFSRSKIVVIDPITKEKKRLNVAKVKLPIPIKNKVSSNKYLIEINNEDMIVQKIYVTTDRSYNVPPCTKVALTINETASTRGADSPC